MNDKPELETMREIWPAGLDAATYHWEVGPDRDGLGCVEIRLREDSKIKERITVPPDVALLISKALFAAATEAKEPAPHD